MFFLFEFNMGMGGRGWEEYFLSQKCEHLQRGWSPPLQTYANKGEWGP